jgi:orotidine-5'-phosphate decarboxylase
MSAPLFVALDVDTDKEALRIADLTASFVGGFKIGPRLALRYGAPFLKEMASRAALFVDNKYFDIPSTMEAAVRASFEVGASLVTIHAQSGTEAMARLAVVEKELSAQRPFKILAVTVLTSFHKETLPRILKPLSIPDMVKDLAEQALESGLSGLVCSPEEIAILRKAFPSAYLLIPGIRLTGEEHGDQKRVADPCFAIQSGASALVVGRPIVQAANPAQAAKEYHDVIAAAERR